MVLATGFVHVLPDAHAALSNPCLEFSTDYPWAFTLAAFAAILTLAIEVAIAAVLRAGLTPGGLDVEHAVGANPANMHSQLSLCICCLSSQQNGWPTRMSTEHAA